MRTGLLYFISLLFSLSVHSQDTEVKILLDSAWVLWYVDFDKTKLLLDQAEKLIAQEKSERDVADLIDIYEIRKSSCNAFSKLQLWREYLGKVDELLALHKIELGDDFTLLRLKNEIDRAQFFYKINDDVKALELFQRLLNEFKNLPESEEVCRQLNVLSNEIAAIHTVRGEYEASINQYLAGIPYLECVDRESGVQRSRALIYRNIGHAYFLKRDYDQARKYLGLAEGSLRIFLRQSPIQESRVALSLYETQSSYYQRIGRHDSALLSIQKAIPLLKLRNVEDPFRGRIALSIGGLYFRERKYHEANVYFNRAENYFLNSQDNQSYYLSNVYLAKADLYEKIGQVESALRYCENAIGKLVLDFRPEDSNPTLQKVLSKKQLFRVLQKKSQLLEKLFKGGQDIAVLVNAFQANQLSLALLDSTANEFSLDKDKVILSEQSYGAFEDGIRIANTLYSETKDEKYFATLLSLIEKSKGILLLENLRLVNRFSGIRQDWLEQEKELKAEMLWIEQSLYETELKTDKSGDLQGLRERYAIVKRDYSSLIEQMKREAPEYYKLRFDHSVISQEAIQYQLLRPGEALIEFFVGDSILAVAGFTKEKKYLNIKKMIPGFNEEMNQFRKLLTTGNSDFLETSARLYDFLLRDCLAELGTGIRSLIVIPDGILGYLPFEVLVQSKDPEVVYLNDNLSVRYANSATYLIEQIQRKPTDAKNFFAGFVSSGVNQPADNQMTARDQEWAILQGAEHEVTSIAKLVSSRFTIFNPANKLDFINHASEYKILHFAMHSSLNDENPMMSVMVFAEQDSTENLLTAIELYSLKLNSELAVLSACNTGMGQLRRGEGIMSFSRAFAYAGVPSAVISLWKVPDAATSQIMLNFYKHLKAGNPKDKALQLARLDFIHDNPAMSHPFYWSGFILTGNAEPIDFPTATRWMWIVGASMLVLVSLYVWRKRRLGA